MARSKIRSALKGAFQNKAGSIGGSKGGVFTPKPGFAAPKPTFTQPGATGSGIGKPQVTGPVTSAPKPPDPTWKSDPIYQTHLAGFLNQENNAASGTNNAIQQGLQGFGLDDNQSFQGVGVTDPVQLQALVANPFSRAQMLKEGLQRANKGAVNSYAAGGQLYSGALRRMVGADGSDYKQKGAWDLPTILENADNPHAETAGGSALLGGLNQKNFLAGLDQLIRERNEYKGGKRGDFNSAIADINTGRAGAAESALERWLANRPDPESVPDKPKAADVPKGAPKPEAPKAANTIPGTDIPKDTIPKTGSPFKDRGDRPKPRGPRWRVVWKNGKWTQVKKKGKR